MARNKINDLRDHLFETLERLKEGDIDIATAKAMADVGQVIINSAKIEIDFIRATGSTKDSGFIKLGDGNEKLIWQTTNQHTPASLTSKLRSRVYW